MSLFQHIIGLVAVVVIASVQKLSAQPPPTFFLLEDSTLVEIELMDTIVFTPEQSIQSVTDLIYFIQQDTTFYKAFKNLHFHNYNADHQFFMYDKKGVQKTATLNAEIKHIYRDHCRWMNVLEETITGTYYNKKGQPNYHTNELFQSLFYETDTICFEPRNLSKDYLQPRGNTIEKNKSQLKLLMFSPGSKIKGIPFIGNKASIFDPSIAKRYHFSMSSVVKNGISCYLFEAVPLQGEENNVIYRSFKTWFDITDMHIVARDYHLKYNSNLYDFDVEIKVALQTKKNTLLVQDIYYNGNWRVISQGRERAVFRSTFYH